MGRTSLFRLSKVPLAPILCFGLAAALAGLSVPTRLEWRTLDERSVLRTHFQKPPLTDIAIVLFDDATDANLESWPPDRKWHAQLMRLMAAAKPSVITWDVIFDADGKTAAGDKSMGDIAGAVTRIGIPVISAAVTSSDPEMGRPEAGAITKPVGRVEGDVSKLLGDNFAVLPFKHLRETTQFAFADTPPGPDGIRREIPLVVRVGKGVYPTLGLATVLAYLHVDPENVLVRLGDAVQFSSGDNLWRIPISETGTYFLNYRYDAVAGGTDFETTEYSQLMFALHAHYVEHKAAEKIPDLKGKIVFLGQVVTGKADAGPTQLGPDSPLVLTHANLVDNVLRGDFVRRWPVWEVCLVLGMIWYGSYNWMIKRHAVAMAATAIVGVAVYLILSCVLWITSSIWLPIVAPVTGLLAVNFEMIVQRIRREQKAKEEVKAKFQSYLPPELIKKMISSGESVEVRSVRRPVTILFSDLRDFTGWSERISETELITQLNEYLSAMVECIHENGGTLHKFIGDAVMSAWGDFVTDGPAEDAKRACNAALAMQKRLTELERNVGGFWSPAFANGHRTKSRNCPGRKHWLTAADGIHVDRGSGEPGVAF